MVNTQTLILALQILNNKVQTTSVATKTFQQYATDTETILSTVKARSLTLSKPVAQLPRVVEQNVLKTVL